MFQCAPRLGPLGLSAETGRGTGGTAGAGGCNL